MRERRGVERPDALEVFPHLARNPSLPFRRAVGQLRSQLRAVAGVDAERGGALRRETKQIRGNPIDELEHFGLRSGVEVEDDGRRVQPYSGSAAAEASAAMASRRFMTP